MEFAPIVLFVYKRPDHLSRVLEHLGKNEGANETILYIFAEGPKEDASESELQKIREVRNIIKEVKGFKKVLISESDRNIGCAKSMTAGISSVLEQHDKAIILEDDILTHPQFLSFCNTGLNLYEHENQIKQIGAFMFPSRSSLPPVFLSRAVFCWGWATWKRAWKDMSMDAERYLLHIRKNGMENKFDLGGSYPYLNSLQQQVSGKIDAWDICWYASIFLKQGLSVYPGKTLTENIGMDGSGTHFTIPVHRQSEALSASANLLEKFPKVIAPDELVEKKVFKSVSEWSEISFRSKVRSKLMNIINPRKERKNN